MADVVVVTGDFPEVRQMKDKCKTCINRKDCKGKLLDGNFCKYYQRG